MMDLGKVTYLLITGASKGIGQTMAIECSKKLKSGSIITLLARSMEGLTRTKNVILESNSKLIVKTYSIDLTESSSEHLSSIINESLLGENLDILQLAFIIHNAGSLGDVTKPAKDIDDVTVLTDYYKLNVFSTIILNSIFMKKFANKAKLVVNITSKCAVEPFKSLTLYCCGKSAREMYFKVLSEEETDTVVLNYAPGPVDTDMPVEIQKFSNDCDLRIMFTQQIENQTLLSPLQTTTKFLEILEHFKFKSGDHIDYFD